LIDGEYGAGKIGAGKIGAGKTGWGELHRESRSSKRVGKAMREGAAGSARVAGM
jgi:hypothetical protein